jgi:quercetin dioxygenase-like cupin family protein
MRFGAMSRWLTTNDENRIFEGDPLSQRRRYAMLRATRMLSVVLAGAIAVGTIGVQGLHAGEEYEPEQYQAKMTALMKTALAGMPGTEAHMIRVEVPPGWIGGKHYHQGHVIVYVLEGAMRFELAGQAPITVGAGEVFHERPGEVMRARNVRADTELKFMVFQLNPEGQPLRHR